MAQARGGPMLTGHTSHQLGLDADIWLTPMPDRELTRQEREEMSATDMVRRRQARHRSVGLDAGACRAHPRRGAEPAIERILVNPAIKKALCREADRRPRLVAQGASVVGAQLSHASAHRLPGRQSGMQAAGSDAGTEGCGADLDYWFRDAILNPPPPKEPPKPKPPLTMADLPPSCKQIVFTP